MKPRIPAWLQGLRRPTLAGTVEVELVCDASRFETAMRETASVLRYQQAVAHQRDLGRAYVGVMLDELARSVGLDPVEAWRLPRARDQRITDLNHPERARRQAAEAAWLAEHRAHRTGAADA